MKTMKIMKKIFAMCLALALALACVPAVFAADVGSATIDETAKGSLTIRKIDATGGPLAGAELLLETSTDGQSWTEIGKVTTGADGIAKWEDLKLGAKYRIIEAKAPAGYTLLPEPVSVDALTADAPDIAITLCNNADFVLPFTGGRGFVAPILLAALMLCMGVYFCKKSDFMKENN